jgi:hypothetical protein
MIETLAVVAQAEPVININRLAVLAVGVVVLVAVLGTAIQAYLSATSQQNLNDIHSMGIQAIVAQNQQTNLANQLQETNETDGDGNGGN